MSRDRPPTPDGATIDQLAALTGVGWTLSLLAFLSTVFGYAPVTWVVDPQSLLYLGGVLFVATVGLDRLGESRLNGNR